MLSKEEDEEEEEEEEKEEGVLVLVEEEEEGEDQCRVVNMPGETTGRAAVVARPLRASRWKAADAGTGASGVLR